MKEIPASSRDFTESLASITLTLKCLPTSRRKSTDQRPEPVRVVADQRGVRAREVQEPFELFPQGGRIGGDLLARLQRAFRTLAARVANQARAAPHQDHWPVTRSLEVEQPHHRNEASDVQAISRRIEAAVASDGAACERVG